MANEAQLVKIQNIEQQVNAIVKKKFTDNQQLVADYTLAVRNLARSNPKILNCSEGSILAGMVACINTGLMPDDKLSLVYLIPYGNELQFQISYLGLCELAYRSGIVEAISAEVVFAADTFEVHYGSNRQLTHIPSFDINRTKGENIIKAYATAKLGNGEIVFAVLTRDEIEKIRAVSKAKSTDSPWIQWYGEMCKKTAVKRLLKLLPRSTKDNRVFLAANYDSWAEAGKLVYKDGEVVEGETVTQPARIKPSIRSFTSGSQSNDEVVPTPVSSQATNELESPAAPDLNMSAVDNTDKSEAELRTEIQACLDYLQLTTTERNTLFEQTINKKSTLNASYDELQRIYAVLSNLAMEKTETEDETT